MVAVAGGVHPDQDPALEKKKSGSGFDHEAKPDPKPTSDRIRPP